jgi:hypothetical protein
MEMLEDYIISMKSNAKDVCHTLFQAWIFQNACRCHGNRKNTQFNTKVNNNHIFSDLVCKLSVSLGRTNCRDRKSNYAPV